MVWGIDGNLNVGTYTMKLASLNPRLWPLSRKVTSIVLVILMVPIFSISLLQEIEKTLVESVKDNLALSNRLIANQLMVNLDWFEQSVLPDSNTFIGEEFFVFPISSKLVLDGFFDEWTEHKDYRTKISNGAQEFSVLLGYSDDNFLVSLRIDDDKVIFPRLDGEGAADSIEIEYKANQQYTTIFLTPTGTGEFAVRVGKSLKPDWRFKAYWLNTASGFNLEIQFPSGINPQEIKITHRDVDIEKSDSHQGQLSTTRFDLNPIVWPSPKFSHFVEQLTLKPAQRIWVLDKFGRVLATKGNLKTDQLQFSRNRFFNWILSNQSIIESDPRNGLLQINTDATYRALNGNEMTRVEYLKGSDNAIAIAAYPLATNEEIKGVLLLEENVARVQILQKKALLKMLSLILVTFLLVVWIIFWYINRTVGRIKKLHQAIEEVVDEQGRMHSPLRVPVEEGDEIDELYRAFSNMGERLYDYNEYLEKLAARLSHELRTPIAIVRSSLDNLALNSSNYEELEVINRALDGNKRLGEIISRMRQASSVKEAMQSTEKEKVDLVNFIRSTVSGFQSSFPKYHFIFETNMESINVNLSVELFSEMFDKLLSNAMDFCAKGQPINIGLFTSNSGFSLQVANFGPTIAKKNLKRVFDSLVSIRSKEHSNGANLGLGLHVVRLIADYHGFSVRVTNKNDLSGVIFEIKSPL